MTPILVYLFAGLAVYFALRALFRRSQLPVRGLTKLWLSWLTSGELIGILLGALFWPIFAVLSLIWWAGELLHRRSVRRNTVHKP
jgi:hypothetical protein